MATRFDPAAAKAVRRSLGTVLVTGGTGFLGSFIVHQLVEIAKTAQVGVDKNTVRVGSMSIHVVDVNPPRPAFREAFKNVTFHRGSVADEAAMRRIFAAVDPDTVIHNASLIDLRPRPSPHIDAVNVDATRHLLELCAQRAKDSGLLTKLVYTSTIECAYEANTCSSADESRPYPATASNGYQRTKIAAEKLVLAANTTASSTRGLKTASIRPAHIFGQGDDLFYLGNVPVCFGSDHTGQSVGARMSMVNVENCAFAHIIAAAQLYPGPKQDAVQGRAFYTEDFDQNIVCLYHELAGTRRPRIQIPYWVLSVMVHVAIFLAILVHKIFCGYQIMKGKSGLHDGALAAGLETTVTSKAAREAFGYTEFVSKSDAVIRCREWFNEPGKSVIEKRVVPQLDPLEYLYLLAPQ